MADMEENEAGLQRGEKLKRLCFLHAVFLPLGEKDFREPRNTRGTAKIPSQLGGLLVLAKPWYLPGHKERRLWDTMMPMKRRSLVQVSVRGRGAEHSLFLELLGKMQCILLHLMAQCSRQHLLCPDNISLVYEIPFVLIWGGVRLH